MAADLSVPRASARLSRACALYEDVEEAQPDLEIDAHRGEQPLYPVIFSIE